MWTRPSWCTPISTKAPKLVTLVTDAFEDHAGFRSLSASTPSRKTAALELGARVAAGLLELAEDVAHRRHAEPLAGVIGRVQSAQEGRIADQVLEPPAGFAAMRSTTG
jgi:hypothetical protein